MTVDGMKITAMSASTTTNGATITAAMMKGTRVTDGGMSAAIAIDGKKTALERSAHLGGTTEKKTT